MSLTDSDLQAISGLVNANSNLILGELDRIEQRINKRFDNVKADLREIREEVHVTKYSNETVELLLKKVSELEERIAQLEKTA